MWLLEASVRNAIKNAYQHGGAPTVEQQVQYEARYGSYEGDASRVLSAVGDVGHIRVSGVITKAPSFLAMILGGGNVTYPEIVSALAEADKTPEIKRIEMHVDSPGGHFDGLFDAIAAMQAVTKPLRAVVRNQAASAAYALVSQADEIVAANRATRFGSIGVVVSYATHEDEVDIASSKAPKKRPDVRTEEGKAVVREELDAMHEIFVEAIADGRNTTPDKINAEFGQGATLLAEDALKRGMIDAIAEAPLRVVKSAKTQTTASSGKKPETGPMDLNTFKAQHREIYEAAVQEGVTQERDRVSAHLEMGEAANALDIAVNAIKAGESYTARHMAQYNAAALRSRDQQNMQADDAQAASAVDGAAQGGQDVADAASQVLALVESQLGISAE
jgi:ClpP class serine protease